MKTIHGLIACLATSVLLVSHCMAQECKDSPLISRFPGSTFRGCTDKADDLARRSKANFTTCTTALLILRAGLK